MLALLSSRAFPASPRVQGLQKNKTTLSRLCSFVFMIRGSTILMLGLSKKILLWIRTSFKKISLGLAHSYRHFERSGQYHVSAGVISILSVINNPDMIYQLLISYRGYRFQSIDMKYLNSLARLCLKFLGISFDNTQQKVFPVYSLSKTI